MWPPLGRFSPSCGTYTWGSLDGVKGTSARGHVLCATHRRQIYFHDLQCQPRRTKWLWTASPSAALGNPWKLCSTIFMEWQELRFWGQNEKKLFSMYMLQNSCNFSNRNRRNYPVLLGGSSHGTWDDSVRRQLGKGNTSKVKTEQWKGYLRESKYNFCRQINKKSWETFTLKCMFSDSAVKSIRYRTNRLVLSLTLTSSATLGRITKSLDFLLHGGA